MAHSATQRIDVENEPEHEEEGTLPDMKAFDATG